MIREPVRVFALLNGAIAATLGVLALVLDWSGELVGGLTLALAAWVALAGEIVRQRVTPVDEPVLTPEQAARVTLDQ